MHQFLNIRHFVVYATICWVWGCRQQAAELHEPNARQYPIDSSLSADKATEAFIAPYRNRVNAVLDTPLSYAPETYTKTDGERNTSLGNLMADIMLRMADSLAARTQEAAPDIALLNHGGVRSILSKGPVTERTSYALMPFENTIFIQELRGETVAEMVRFLRDAGVPHPVSGMKIRLDDEGRIDEISIGGKPLNQDSTYRVATSSYLVSGGDGMDFFKKAVTSRDTGYKIRNALTDYFKATDTLRSALDDRFTQKNRG